jgi:Putative transposase
MNLAGHAEDTYREGTTHIVMSPLEFIRRLAALVPVRGCI